MKLTSCTHSFIVFALSLLTLPSVSPLSIDSKAVAKVQPRAVIPDASSSSLSLRKRKKCSFTPPVPSAALSTSNAAPLVTGSPAGNQEAGIPPANNASSLANQLSYARSYKTKCRSKTSTRNLPLPGGTPVSSEGADTGAPGAPSSTFGLSVPASSSTFENVFPQSDYGGGSPSSVVANSQPLGAASSAGACGPQQTITVTSQTTITVTQLAGAATSTGGGEIAPGTNLEVASQSAQAAFTSELKATMPSIASVKSSGGSKRTKCSGGGALSTAITAGSSGSGSSGSSTPSSGPDSTGPSESALTATSPPNSGLSGSASLSDNGPYGNGTSSAAVSPSGSSRPLVPLSASNSTNTTSNANLNGQFWAGATLGTVMRMEAIPSRVFYDFDGTTVKDPFKTLGDVGVNALRIEGSRGQCLGPSQFINNGSTLGEELTFTLDWGCLDVQVKTAQRGVAEGMRVVLTINQGFDIPEGMEEFSYEQMVVEVQKETKRQLQPFLDVSIVPDVILFENEGSDGFLFNDTTTGHTRGHDDGKVSKAQLDQELCGKIPTGNLDSFPQYAGYLKAEVMACNEAISTAGLSNASVRYGLHSHGQYVQWKESLFHGPNPSSQSELKDSSGQACSNSVIPADILSANASELITIMGFSAYADPMTPADINSAASQRDALNRTLTTLTQMMGYAEAYGKYESGPFAGEYKLQALGVEYGTTYTYEQIPQEQQITTLMWSLVKQFPNVLGMLWYEPWYCHGDWEGGNAALCHNIDGNGISGEAPTEALKTWGAAALSPWR